MYCPIAGILDVSAVQVLTSGALSFDAFGGADRDFLPTSI